MGSTLPAILLFFAGSPAFAAEAPADAPAIMKMVAARTSAATEGRRRYIYTQKVRASLLRSNGEVVCKESRAYLVIPQDSNTDKTLTSFSGECRDGKRMTAYGAPESGRHVPGLKEKGSSNGGDRESIVSVIDDLVDVPDSRDGIPAALFPLRAEDLPYYSFTLKGESLVRGRRAWDILFEPVDKKDVCIHIGADDGKAGKDDGGFKFRMDMSRDNPEPDGQRCRPWKGEAWIDAEDYQPIRIITQLAKTVPWGVRTLLGIDIRQPGFSINYQRLAENVWFPATYGTEFRVVVFWGFRRTITMSMENSDFRRTDAKATIQFDLAIQ